MKYELPQLPYAYDALEPFIDKATMELHHAKHHAGYVAKLNEALAAYPDLREKSLEELLSSLDSIPEAIRTAVRNQGGGHWNHSFFWKTMKPADGSNAREDAEAIRMFGGFEKLKEEFTKAALGIFGSGWAWLAADGAGNLSVVATPNQDTPISKGMRPLLGLDVWEHAYYLKHQNRRAEYIEAWWNVVNWDQVDQNMKR